MSTRSRLMKATGGMAVVTVVSRISGYVRDKAIALLLGAGPVADAFYAGLAVPSMFRAFLAEGALHAAFIPTLSEMRERRSPNEQREFVRAMTSVLLLALPIVVAAGVLLAPWLVRVFAVGFVREPTTYVLAVHLTRLMFPYLGLISLAALAQGVLNASDRFLLPAATPIALNLFIVAGVVTATELRQGEWWWLAVGVVVGGFAQLAVQWPACRRLGLPLLPGGGGWRHPEVRKVLALMVPGIPALGIYQITLLLSYRFASSVGSGAVTWRFNAARLNELVYGVLLVQLTTAILPMLAAERARDEARAKETLGFAFRVLTLVTIPSAVFLVVMAPMVVGTAFGGGRYSPGDVATTATALAMYAWGLPFLGLTKLLAGASYAWKDTRIPVIAAGVNLVAFWILGVWWTSRFGVAGIAAAASAGQALNMTMLIGLGAIAGRMPRMGDVLPGVSRHIAAGTIVAVLLVSVRSRIPAEFTTSLSSIGILAATIAGAALVYAVALVLMRAPEWKELRGFLASRRRA